MKGQQMLDSLSIAVVQAPMRPVDDFDDYADWVTQSLLDARGAELVVLPELVTTPLFTISPNWRRQGFHENLRRIASYTPAYVRLFTELSAMQNQVIAAGTQLVATSGGFLNSAHIFLPDGSVRTHAKTHLDPVERAWGTVEGETLAPVDIGGVRIGVTICYEAEIPEVCTTLARQGADVILCPSYVSSRHGYWRIRHSGAARCVENLVYFVHCPLAGHLGGSIPDAVGQATALSPCDPGFPEDGVLAESRDDLSVLRITLDLVALRSNRQFGASTFLDRPMHEPLYRRYSKYLRTDDPYVSAVELLDRSASR